MSVCAVVGGQFGSEGKGLIVGHIAREYDHHVRVGAANAGHTLYTDTRIDPLNTGGLLQGFEKHVMQQVPCAAYANPDAELYIGPGALISPEIFGKELADLQEWRRTLGLRPIYINVDPHAHVILPEHVEREQDSGLAERIGSTSTIAREGIGAAQAARVMREESCVIAGTYYDGVDDVALYEDPWVLNDPAMKVLLEGTQGTGLSLTTGPFPFVTSRNTAVAGLCADSGVAPSSLDRVILVLRTYPIRVAGNSGPFDIASEEIGWEELGVDPESERTTVTKKIRRVATFSMHQAAHSAVINGATEIALTFCDYLDPTISGESGEWPEVDKKAYPNTHELVKSIEQFCLVPVRYLGTGPHSVIHLRDDR